MKKKFLLILIGAALFNIVDASAQGQQANRQLLGNDFWERRNDFIKKEVGLTADEASKFIPLETEFRQKIIEIGRECRSLARESQNRQKMPDSDYSKLVDCQIETRIKEAQLEKEYYERFKKILSPEKLYKYQQADINFSRELVNNVRRTATPVRSNSNRTEESNNTNRPENRNNNNTNRSGNTR